MRHTIAAAVFNLCDIFNALKKDSVGSEFFEAAGVTGGTWELFRDTDNANVMVELCEATVTA